MEIHKLISYWKKDKNNKYLVCDIIREYWREENEEAALTFLNSLSPELQKDSEVVWSFSHPALISGNFDLARQILVRLPESDSGYMYGMAVLHFLEGDFSVARNYLAPLLKQENISVAFVILEMRCLHHSGDLDEAIKLGKTYSQRFNSNELNGLIALIALDANQSDLALEFATKVLALEPTQLDAALAMASVLVARQQFEQAQPVCQMLNECYPNSGRAWSLSGQLQFLNNHSVAAKQCFTLAVQHMPDHIGTWHLKAWCELLTDEVFQAQDSFQKALDLNRNFADSHAGIALVYIFQNKFDAAKQKIKLANRLDPNSQTAIFAQSLLLRNEGNQTEADQLVTEILAKQSHLEGQTYQTLVEKFIQIS